MLKWPSLLLGLLLLASTSRLTAAEARVRLQGSAASPLLSLAGDHDDDWRVQVSTNLRDWVTLTNFGTLISGGQETNAPWRAVTNAAAGLQFFRAQRTAGLYDRTLFRQLNLIFTQANWPTLLANGRTYDTNTACTVFLDNGATNFAVGARYKGNTSYTSSGTKKSINLEFDWPDTNGNLMHYQTVNLNNAAADETIMREALYFNVMSRYTPCPQGAMCRVHINGALWGVYSLVEQENTQLIQEWFPSASGDRWRAPNAPGGGGGPGPGGGGGFVSSNSAFAYFGTAIAGYTNKYALKTDNTAATNAWQRLVNAIVALNTTPTNTFRDGIENSFAVDSWLWFLGLEILFADDDSYWNKGADYGFYFEPESGRLHPVEHDGNEAFVVGDVSLSPVVGFSATGGNATLNNRPLLYRLLAVNELKQRYLAHLRTVLEESYHPAVLTPVIEDYVRLSLPSIQADPNKGFTMAAYTNDVLALKQFVINRYRFLTNHAELLPVPPDIAEVQGPSAPPIPAQAATITARVSAEAGIDSVWLYHRGRNYGVFQRVQMFDDGGHGDGAADDGVFGAATTNYPAGTKVRYYVEARAANSARAARFAPARAEHETYDYRVALVTATNTPVVINELLASNRATLADPQGEFDDWIELRNLTDQPVDLTGRYLSDEPNNPRKWAFPAGTTIPADGYLLVWADEDSLATPGLHCSFKLSGAGEQVFLTDTDANLNAVLDAVEFGPQSTDVSYGRSGTNADAWTTLLPTPGQPNP